MLFKREVIAATVIFYILSTVFCFIASASAGYPTTINATLISQDSQTIMDETVMLYQLAQNFENRPSKDDFTGFNNFPEAGIVLMTQADNEIEEFLYLSWVEIEQRKHKSLIEVEQREQGRTKKEIELQEPVPPEKVKGKKHEKPRDAGKEPHYPKAEQESKPSMDLAWQYYGQNNYFGAVEIFTKLISSPATEAEAKYGLAMSYAQLKENKKAISLLEELTKRRVHTKDAVHKLIELYLDNKEYGKASSFLTMLDGADKRKWDETIKTSYLNSTYTRLRGTNDIEKMDALLEEIRREELSQNMDGVHKSKLTKLKVLLLNEKISALNPEAPEAEKAALEILSVKPGDKAALVFLAWRYFNTSRYEKAYECFSKLHQLSPEDIDYAFGLAKTMVKLGKTDEALQLLAARRGNKKFHELEKDIKLQILRDKLSALQSDSPENEEIAKAILTLEPGDKWASTVIAWRYFNTGRYEGAYEGFSGLNRRYPDDFDFAYGLVNTLVKLGKNEEALKLAATWRDNEKLASVERDIKLTILMGKLYGSGSIDTEAEEAAKEILSVRPFEDGVRVTLAWRYFSNDQYEKAYEEFFTLYKRTPLNKEYAYGFVLTLVKLNKFDEALEIIAIKKIDDERFVDIETDIYRDKANAAYKDKKYYEAEINFKKVFEADPEDYYIKNMIAMSKYNQTSLAKVLSLVEGLPGHSWGNISHSLNGETGTGISVLINQGIDWFRLPGDIMFNTFAEYRYRTRSNDRRYFDANGQTLGLKFKKDIFEFGFEHTWENYPELNTTSETDKLFLSGYKEWYKYMKGGDSDNWLGIQAFSGEAYGRITHDLGNQTGTSISGYVNQGIDWTTLPGGIILNTFAEYRFSFRTKDTFSYNAHGPALGIQFQKKPFRLGMDYFWQNYTKQHVTDKQWRLYFSWYYDWDLKRIAERRAEAAPISESAEPLKIIETPKVETKVPSLKQEAKTAELKETAPGIEEKVPAAPSVLAPAEKLVAPVKAVEVPKVEEKPTEIKETKKEEAVQPEPEEVKREERPESVPVVEPSVLAPTEKALEPVSEKASETAKAVGWGYLELQVPEEIVAGESFMVKVQAYDIKNNLITSFSEKAKEFNLSVTGDAKVEQLHVFTTAGVFYIKVTAAKAGKIVLSVTEVGKAEALVSKEIIVNAQ